MLDYLLSSARHTPRSEDLGSAEAEAGMPEQNGRSSAVFEKHAELRELVNKGQGRSAKKSKSKNTAMKKDPSTERSIDKMTKGLAGATVYRDYTEPLSFRPQLEFDHPVFCRYWTCHTH